MQQQNKMLKTIVTPLPSPPLIALAQGTSKKAANHKW
jgi:hypothetical protein